MTKGMKNFFIFLFFMKKLNSTEYDVKNCVIVWGKKITPWSNTIYWTDKARGSDTLGYNQFVNHTFLYKPVVVWQNWKRQLYNINNSQQHITGNYAGIQLNWSDAFIQNTTKKKEKNFVWDATKL